MASAPALIADIGGTNARFALAAAGQVGYAQELVLPCREFDSADAAIRRYLNEVGVTALSAMSLAVAGPVVAGKVQATNSHWRFEAQQLREAFGIAKVLLLNDFEAIAYSLPHLNKADLLSIGGITLPHRDDDQFNVAVIGPGTGLGVAGLVARGGVTTALVTEGGHVGFAPETSEQRRLLERLAWRFGRVSNERLVSGPGVQNIYWALGEQPTESSSPSAAEIFQLAAAKTDPLAAKAVELFFKILGQAAGNAALAQGAFDGVYLAGGLAHRYANLLPSSRFREGFENKGRYRGVMEGIPTALITHPYPGLLGAAAAALP